MSTKRYKMNNIKAGVLYEIQYRCTTPGPEVEEGEFTGYWSGQVDTWGKLTFAQVKGPCLYLFERELVSMKEVKPLQLLAMVLQGVKLC